LFGVDIGSKYATEIDTIDDLKAANEHLRRRPVAAVSARLAI
jgi:hypothetical protein